MHERAVTQSVLDISLRHAERAEASKVLDIYLVIGQLSSMVDESIQYYWDIISADTLAEGANLHFKRIAAVFECKDCGELFAPDGKDYVCPACESTAFGILRGEEFYVEAIEVA